MLANSATQEATSFDFRKKADVEENRHATDQIGKLIEISLARE